MCYPGLVHDRRIDGSARVFGNQAWLYMRAMTWWDRETGSIWSHPIGTALTGPLRGTKLRLLPSALVTWETRRAEHPKTLVLDEHSFALFRARPHDNFVIGIVLGEHVKALRGRILTSRTTPHSIGLAGLLSALGDLRALTATRRPCRFSPDPCRWWA